MKRKFLSTLMAICLALSLVPTAAFAEEGEAGTETKTYYVGQSSGGALEGQIDFTTINSAIEQIQKDGGTGTIQLLTSINEEAVTVPADVTITLDLNDCTVSNSSNHTIVNKGTLKILDSTGDGAICTNAAGKSALQNEPGATAVLENVKLYRTNSDYYVITNHGQMTINGSTISSNSSSSSAIENGWYTTSANTTNNNPTLVINDGTFTGGMNTVKNDEFGILEINDGDFSNTMGAVILNWNKATIKGGTFQIDQINKAILANGAYGTTGIGELTVEGGIFTVNGTGGLFGYPLSADSAKGVLKITGGTFNNGTMPTSVKDSVNPSSGETVTGGVPYDLTISGGQFSDGNVKNYVASNYESVDNGDGTFTVGLIEDKLVVDGGIDEATGGVTGSLEGSFSSDSTTTVEDKTGSDITGENDATITNEVTVNLTTSKNTTATTLKVTKDTAESLGGANKLTVKTDVADVSFNNTSLDKMGTDATDEVVITVTDSTSNYGENTNVKAAYTVTATSNGAPLLPYGGTNNGIVTITVEKPTVDTGKTLQAWYVNNGVYTEDLTSTLENVGEHQISVTIGHLSTIVFTDTAPSATVVAQVFDDDGTFKSSHDDLQAAINAANPGDTVRLMNDVKLTAPSTGSKTGAINISKNLIIDGQDKYTISAEQDFTGNIVDWGEQTPIGNFHVINITGGNVTLKNLTVDGKWSSSNTVGEDQEFGARSGIHIYGGTVTLEDVTVKGCSTYAVTVNQSNSKVTIKGLTTDGTNRYGINVDQGGFLTVEDAIIEEADSIVYENNNTDTEKNGSLTISGGEYQNVVVQSGTTETLGGSVELTGGTFKGVVDKTQNTSADENEVKEVVTVSGGQYTNATGAGYVDISSLLKEQNNQKVDDNGYVVPDPNRAEASIGSIGYETLSAAIAAAKSGDTVLLQKPVETSTIIRMPAGVTLNGNNNSITYIGEMPTTNPKVLIVMGGEADNVTIQNVTLNTKGKLNHGVEFFAVTGGRLSGVTVNGGAYTAVQVNGSTGITIENCVLNPDTDAYTNIEYCLSDNAKTNGGTTPTMTIQNVTFDTGTRQIWADKDTIDNVNEEKTGDQTDAEIMAVINSSITNKNSGSVTVSFGLNNDQETSSSIPGTTPVTPSNPDSSSGGGSSDPSYSPILDVSDGGTIKVNPRTPSEGDEVTITPDPDAGYEVGSVTVTDRNGREIDITAERNGTYTFEQPRGRVTIEVNFIRTGESGLPFVDVPVSAYYYNAVEWALENNITGGTTAVTFSPNDACTRAQMVTFLWRTAGEPEPETSANPFTDVSASAYYYDAVLWAVERGITNGTTATTFSPDATVTRGQTVTFLWRYASSPTASGSSFTDVTADAYYSSAVAWAVNEGITNGTTAATFAPDSSCTRAQIVTFLYRAQ